MSKGWIAFDLDGTLASYDHWRGIEHIGQPIKPMIDRAKDFLKQGIEVRIFTARVSVSIDDRSIEETRKHIEVWCLENIGRVLPVTCCKDYGMVALYDDRCVQVEPNTGVILGKE